MTPLIILCVLGVIFVYFLIADVEPAKETLKELGTRIENVELEIGTKERMRIYPYAVVKSERKYIDVLFERNKLLESKIKLLESHLNLKYYPASEEKKEARYEEKAEELILNVLTNKTRLMKKLGDRPTQKIKKTKKK